MKNIKFNNNHNVKHRNIKTILSILHFKRKIFPYRILMKHKSKLCTHGSIQKWGVNYWETYTLVVN